jgi:hypothetical protein
MRHTSRKRSSLAPLASIDAPAWLVVRDGINAVLESTELGPGTDLRGVLTAARDAQIAAGWLADDIGPACGFFFAGRNGARVRIGVERAPPRDPWTRSEAEE